MFALDTAKDAFDIILQIGAGTGLLYLVRSFGRETGIADAIHRFSYLVDLAHANGYGFLHALAYLFALNASKGENMVFPRAYPSQILNQYLFFQYFPRTYRYSTVLFRAFAAWPYSR